MNSHLLLICFAFSALLHYTIFIYTLYVRFFFCRFSFAFSVSIIWTFVKFIKVSLVLFLILFCFGEDLLGYKYLSFA